MAWYFFGGGAAGISGGALTEEAVKQLDSRVTVVVQEPARRKAARATLGELRQAVGAFEKEFAAAGISMSASYRDHGADRAEIEAVLDDLNREWERGQQRALDLRFELRDRLTRDEWEALFMEGKGR
jgi:hypothetical protein